MNRSTHQKLLRRKRRIGRKLQRAARGRAAREAPVMGGRNIRYEVADRAKGIACGGIGAMHLLARHVGLAEAIDRELHLLKRHLPYHESDHVLSIAYNGLAGGTCIQDLELLRTDEAFLDALGIESLPDPTTAGDFCRRFKARDVETLMGTVNQVRLRVWKQQPPEFFARAVIDADGTLAPTTGSCKGGMDIAYEGTWGYHPLVVSLANTREPLFGGTVFGRESVTAVLADGTTAGSATRNIVDNATVVARRVFYNNSAFDGNTSGAAAGNDGPNNDDDEALAPDTEPSPDPDPTVVNAKRALLPGQQATFANYTSFSKGLNGIMIDLAGLPDGRTLAASDFVFKVGNTATLSSWTAAPAPTFFTIRQGKGVASSDRVTLIWEDNAIQNQWLQVTIRTTANAGLASPDVFYFGNLIGDTGVNTSGPYATLAEDYSRTRAAVDPNPNAAASILSLFDHNRDGELTDDDYLLIPPNYFKTLLLLNVPA